MSDHPTYPALLSRRLIVIALQIAFTLIVLIKTVEAREGRELLPAGMSADLFPTQSFDENAPFCLAEREPCGFYSFSLHGKAPFRWIKSWCRCSPKHECVYDRTDMKMRVYRQTCVSKDIEEEEEQQELLEEQEQTTTTAQSPQEQQSQQPHRSHKMHRHIDSKRHLYPF